MEYPKFKVCCRCFTFNQAKYITDAMNGFTMQQTSFPFVCTIVDDASTDGEQDVIRKYVNENFDFSEGSVAYHKETDYAHITYAQHKTNKNCYFAVLYLKENLYSKNQHEKKMEYISEWRNLCEYEALCEGDDYWIVPEKLERQVTALDSDSSLSLCAHWFNKFNQRNNSIEKVGYDGNVITLNTLIKNHSIISTNSMVYRRECINSLNSDFIKKYIVFDYSIKILLAIQGGVLIIPEIMSTYREYSSASWTSQARVNKDFLIEHHLFAIESIEHIIMLSDRSYEPILREEIVRRETEVAILKGDLNKILKKPWSDFFSAQSLRSKLSFYLHVIFPIVYNFMTKIKK